MNARDAIAIVIGTVASVRGLDEVKVRSIYRMGEYPRARHEVCWICRDLRIGTQSVVGKELFLQSEDVAWALRRTCQLMDRNWDYSSEVIGMRDMCLNRFRGQIDASQRQLVDRFEAMNVARRILRTANPHLHATAPELRGMAAALLGVTETTIEGDQHV